MEEGDEVSVAVGDADVADADLGVHDFVGVGDKGAGFGGFDIGDIDVDADGGDTVGVAGGGEGEIGKGEDRAAVDDAQAVAVLEFGVHGDFGAARGEFEDADAQELGEAVPHDEVVGGIFDF